MVYSLSGSSFSYPFSPVLRAHLAPIEEEVKAALDLVDLCTVFEDAGIVADPELPLDDNGDLNASRIEPGLDENCVGFDAESFEIWVI